MASLAELLVHYPILESLASALTFGSLLNLSRVNRQYRIALHGFDFSKDPQVALLKNGWLYLDTGSRADALEDPESFADSSTLAEADNIKDSDSLLEWTTITSSDTIIARSDTSSFVHPALRIGYHQTDLWRHLKRITRLDCAEACHTKGDNPHCCKMCSMPVCFTCIVKTSFGKKENTFQNRKRFLCEDCWSSGNPCREQLRHGPEAEKSRKRKYDFTMLCTCTAGEGIICSGCKEEQKRQSILKPPCAGHKCPNSVNEDDCAGRICQWCWLVLPGPRSRAKYWEKFDARFAFEHNVEPFFTDHPVLPNFELYENETTNAMAFLGTPYEDQRWVALDELTGAR